MRRAFFGPAVAASLASDRSTLAANDTFNLIAEAGTTPNLSFGNLPRSRAHGGFDRVGESFRKD